MTEPTERALSTLTALVPALLDELEALALASRHLDPLRLPELVALTEERAPALRSALTVARDTAWPSELESFRDHLFVASEEALGAVSELAEAAASAEGPRKAFRAMRRATRAETALYPIAALLPSVSRYFLEPDMRADAARIENLAAAEHLRQDVGVMHSSATPGERGGFSMYVPEDYDPSSAYPLVMALHGGSGNGGAFLWSWLRAARSRGAILVAPTAVGRTRSLRDPDEDSTNIEAMLRNVRERWTIDELRLLLTGMSDGGTFALLSGLSDTSPFTHLAPAATGFHPMLLEMVEPERLAGLPIYLIHGALDWMFDVGGARGVARGLARGGANVTYRELDDLSHVYPRDENPRILDWLEKTTPGLQASLTETP